MHRKNPETMNLFGAIAAIPAISTYRKAKSEYNALVEKKTAMEAAVRTYNQTKYLADDGAIADKSVDNMPGVLTTAIIRFGVWAFGIIWIKPSIVFTNMSDTDYRIIYTGATFRILKKYGIVMTDKAGNTVEQYKGEHDGAIIVKAHDTLEVPFTGGYSKLINPETGEDDTQKLWDLVAEAQKTSGTSAVEIDGALTADITTMWDKNGKSTRSYYRNKPGVILYGK